MVAQQVELRWTEEIRADQGQQLAVICVSDLPAAAARFAFVSSGLGMVVDVGGAVFDGCHGGEIGAVSMMRRCCGWVRVGDL